MTDFTKLSKQALALPLKDQWRIMYLLIKSLEVPGGKISKKEIDRVWKSDRGWKAELEKRIEDHRSGKPDRLMAELRAKCN